MEPGMEETKSRWPLASNESGHVRRNLADVANFKLNCLELGVGVVSFGIALSEFPITRSFLINSLVYCTQLSLILICIVVLGCHCAGKPPRKSILVTISAVSSILWLVTGAMIFYFRVVFNVLLMPGNVLVFSSLAALNNTAIYLVDAVLLCRRGDLAGRAAIQSRLEEAQDSPCQSVQNYARL